MHSNQKKLQNRFQFDHGYFRKLRWRERFKILFGYNLAITVLTRVDKRDQRVWQHCQLEVTKELTPHAQREADSGSSK